MLPIPDLRPSRRQLLQSAAGGFFGMVLADLLRGQSARERQPHFAPRAKHVIFLFMSGGPSHLDLFDPKPALRRYQGQRPAGTELRTERLTGGLLPSPWRFGRCGQSGLDISELLPNLQRCADELCLIRSVYGSNPNHSPASDFLMTGRTDATHPSLGAWVSYGLGSANEDLPAFVSLRQLDNGSRLTRNGYLPGEHQGTPIDLAEPNPERMIRHLRNPRLGGDEQRRQMEFLRALNAADEQARGAQANLEARVRSLETAYRMQSAAGAAFDVRREPAFIRDAYGSGPFATGCLLARRLVERGVRYVHLELQRWDHHQNIERELPLMCQKLDQPAAALLRDLRQRGLLDETLVIWGGEFGRTPVSENGNGRDHNHYGFSMWLAGGGVKGGLIHGATDEFGFRAVQDRVSVHDLHATILYLLGLDHERLTYRYSGRDFRLTDVSGEVVRPILA
jgi:hypothetical protein